MRVCRARNGIENSRKNSKSEVEVARDTRERGRSKFRPPNTCRGGGGVISEVGNGWIGENEGTNFLRHSRVGPSVFDGRVDFHKTQRFKKLSFLTKQLQIPIELYKQID